MDTVYKEMNNVWSPYVLDKVKELIMGTDCPWYLCTTDYYGDYKNPNSHKWQHIAFHKNLLSSQLGPYLEIAVLDALGRSGQDIAELIRIRCSVTEIGKESFIAGAHVDTNTPHRTALFYINDSDGDTILYNELFDPAVTDDQYKFYVQYLNRHVTVAATSTPVENKMIWFDGLRYHSSNSPTTVAKRFIINVNYTVKS